MSRFDLGMNLERLVGLKVGKIKLLGMNLERLVGLDQDWLVPEFPSLTTLLHSRIGRLFLV